MTKTTKRQFDEGVNFTYFQYYKDLDYPVYIRVSLEDFDPDIQGFLLEMNFVELKESEEQVVWSDITSRPNAKLLTISEASNGVARQVEMIQESDRYGAESIIPKKGYGVYRYKDVGMMVYSLASREWELGVFPDFGSPRVEVSSRIVLNRFLSWALSSMGVVGFWGTPVDEGVVIMKQQDSKGEAVFFDLKNKRLISMDGHRKLRSRFKLIRLSKEVHARSLPMSKGELLSYLTVHCSFFDHRGLSRSIRQLIQAVSKSGEGLVCPIENFSPRVSSIK